MGEHLHVDHEVEVHEDATSGQDGVDDDLGAVLELLDSQVAGSGLFCDQRSDVGLETTCACSHDDDRDNEARKGAVGVGDDRRNGRNGEEDVSQHADDDGSADSLVATPSK